MIAFGIVIDVWFAALVVVHSRHRTLRLVYVALSAAFVASGGILVGIESGFLSDPTWLDALRGTYAIAHVLVPAFVFAFAYGKDFPRGRSATIALGLLLPIVAAVPSGASWTARLGYQLNPYGLYLIACLGIAFLAAIAIWLRSPLLGTEGFWLIAGTFALLDTGPLFAYQFTRFPDPGPSSLGSPVALAVFAVALLHANPLPTRFPSRRKRAWITSIARSRIFVLDERRPMYVEQLIQREAASGRPVIVLERDRPVSIPAARRVGRARIEGSVRAALRTWMTIRENLARKDGWAVVVKDLAAIAALSGWSRTVELVRQMEWSCHRFRMTAVFCTSRLKESERNDLRRLQTDWWVLPDPSDEVAAILSQYLGSAADPMLDEFAASQGLSRHTLTLTHIPALGAFLQRKLGELTSTVADRQGAERLKGELTLVLHSLELFGNRGAAEIATGRWPSRALPKRSAAQLVTARDYWQGKAPEPPAATPAPAVLPAPSHVSLYDQARSLFVEHLGPAGESLLKIELSALDGSPRVVSRSDVARLSDRAAVDLGIIADAIDLDGPRAWLRERVQSLCRNLQVVGGEL